MPHFWIGSHNSW